MEYIKFKNTDLTVSRFCMGGCPMGGYGWGKTNEDDFLEAIKNALDMGVNYFDTADTYGLGQSERTLAKGLGARRKDVVIQSKFGVCRKDGKTHIDNSPEYIRKALEETLERLNTDYIDIYVVHYWDGKTPAGDIVEELEAQRRAGKIRYFGLSNIYAEAMPLWLPYADRFSNVQYEFSLACRSHEGEIKTAQEHGLTPLTWGSLGQGILTGKYGADVTFGEDDRRNRKEYVNFHGEKLLHNLKIVDKLREIAESREKTVASCAIRFILDYLKDSVVIAGVKNKEQLYSNLASMDWHLSKSETDILNEVSQRG